MMTTTEDKYAQLSPLKRALLAIEKLQAKLSDSENSRREPVAIIGMSCRFPGSANTPEAYWQLMRAGRDAIIEVPPDRWDIDAYYDPDPNAPGKMSTRWGGFLDQVDQFDPEFFGIAPREALLMDPQQRLLLEVSWEALEHAGQAPDRLSGSRSGVFVGITSCDYASILSGLEIRARSNAYFASGIARSVASGRISYLLGLQGPSLSIDTACSSSLVAVHQACQSLRSGECRLALAGGVNLILLPDYGITFSKSKMMASDGRCKTFDARADGFVRAEGCGMIVLKRLNDALQDGDSILGLILANAANQDGSSSGLTAPNGLAQEAVMREALSKAGLTSTDVSYVEAHGTGTSLGDPIEVRALGSVFGKGRRSDKPLMIGSVKTNVGHLEAAAGIASLIKVVLCMQHREIPPNLHFDTPNPHIHWDELPVTVPKVLQPWLGDKLIAGVSSFGFSGTNVHLLIGSAFEFAAPPAKSAEEPISCPENRAAQILTLSAKSEEALRALAGRYADHMTRNPEVSLGDFCHTANSGRAGLSHRVAITGIDSESIRSQLSAMADGKRAAIEGVRSGTDKPRIAFLFTGQGSQYAGMGWQLFQSEPGFRKTLEHCDTILQPYLEKPLLSVLYPKPGEDSPINETAYTQPALFALEYALAELWRSWGIEPALVLGHSVGEYVAACVAGMFSLEDGLKLIATRARLMQSLPPGGSMVAILTDEASVREAVKPYADMVSVAVLNGPENIVVSGSGAAVAAVAGSFEARKIRTQKLVVSHAFHSPLMEPILDQFERSAGSISFSRPQIGLVSNLTGELINVAPEDLPAYWRRHIREAVQFEKGMKTLVRHNPGIFLEIGPSPLMLAMGKRCVSRPDAAWLPTLRKGREDWEQLLESLGHCFVAGADVNWNRFDRVSAHRKIVLPTYPFQRQRYWAEDEFLPETPAAAGAASGAINPVLGRKLESPALDGTVFETEIGPESFYRFAYEHRVLDRPILPATAFLQMAVEAADILSEEPVLSIEDFVLSNALTLPEQGKGRLQFALSASDPGNFRIFSREAEGRSSWKLHGNGKIGISGPQRTESHAPKLQELQSKCRASVVVEDFYGSLQEKGLDFGPSFHTLQEIWKGADEAIARVSISEPLASHKLAGGIHPVQLDGCLQVLAAALPGSLAGPEYLFLPVSLDRYHLFAKNRSNSGNVWAHATVHLQDQHRTELLNCDLHIYGEDGMLLAEMAGLHLKRVRAGAFSELPSTLKSLLYDIQWQAKQLSSEKEIGSFAFRTTEIAAQVDPLAPVLSQKHGWDRFDALEPRLNLLCAQYIIRAFRELGWQMQPGSRATTDELCSRMGIASRHTRLASRFLRILAEDGLLQETDSGKWQVNCQPELANPEALAEELQHSFPEFDAELSFAARCGQKLAQALTGECDPLQLLFPGGDASEAEKLYQASPSAQVYNELLQQSVTTAINGLPPDRHVRLLEIGGGTASTTAYLTKVLPPDRTEYLFTDISPLFAARCREKLGSYSFLKTQTLDIEQDPGQQGIKGPFDIVVASNVVHATRDLAETFSHIRQLLTPGGLLLLLEIMHPQRWVDLSFGLTDGWWRFTDTDLRPSYPLLTADEWIPFLESHGFNHPVSIPQNVTGSKALAVDRILLAIAETQPSQEASHPGRWLIFQDATGIGQSLKNELADLQRPVVSVFPGPEYAQRTQDEYAVNPASPEDFLHLVEHLSGQEPGKLEGVVYLWGAEACIAAEVEELQSTQARICGGALHLVQGLLKANASKPPALWFVTKGSLELAHQRISPLQSPIWGLARSLAWEHPELKCTCVDLDPGAANSSVDSLLAELLSPDGEAHIAYRDQTRYAARLRSGHLPSGLIPTAPHPCSLVIETRGILDNIELKQAERPAPAPGEVEIQIRAAGMNFRDVLNALNMYPGDPGPLGSECAGIITKVGAGVDHLRPGDDVIAIAAGCFGSFVTCKTDLVIPKPERMSFEESVTIPNAFLTAYWALVQLGKMQRGDKVLIHAACGGVGLAAVQLAQQAGAEVYATAGSYEKRSYLQSIGIRHVFDSRTLAFSSEILQATDGKGVDLVLNSLSGEFIPKSLSLLKPGGRFLEIGRTAIWTAERVREMRKDISYFAINLGEEYRDTPAVIRDIWHGLMNHFARGYLKPLPLKIFPLADAIPAFRYMAQARHIGKIVLTLPWQPAHSGDTQALLRPDASYLITGAFGGLGLALAEWLPSQGAKHLVLVGRRAPDEAAMNLVRRLEAQGIHLEAIVADAASEEGIRAVFEKIRKDWPPLKGVFHLAGTLENATILQQNWERFCRVLAPKISGGWLLHRYTRHLDLDHFVLFSSAASLLGSPGQSNHAAANAFLDALAFYRRSQGLPGISINWGAWSEVGAAASIETSGRIAERGILPITPREGFALLKQFLTSPPAQIGAMRIDPDAFKDSRNKRLSGYYFSGFGGSTVPSQAVAQEKPGRVSQLHQMASLPPNKRRGQLQTHIREQAITMLGLKPGYRIDPNAPLHSLGLDSLMAVELRNALGATLECELPSTLLFDYPTIDGLTDFIAKRLNLIGPDEARPEKAAAGPVDLLDQLEQISDSELERLFAEKIKDR